MEELNDKFSVICETKDIQDTKIKKRPAAHCEPPTAGLGLCCTDKAFTPVIPSKVPRDPLPFP